MPNSNIARFTITIDQNKKCLECGKGGATENGLCLNCTSKALEGIGNCDVRNVVSGATCSLDRVGFDKSFNHRW